MIDDRYIENLMNNPREGRVLLLSSLEAFARVFHYYLNRNQFIVKDFHRRIIRKLEDMVFQRNEKNNLYIGMCPRSGKSQLSLYFEGWGFAHNPQSNYLSVSYGGELIKKFSKQVRDMISSPLYEKLFGVSIERDTSASDLWKTTNGGEYRATTLQGTITGFGAGQMRDGWGGCIVIDDFLKAQDARSATEKKKVIECYENTIKSRKNNPNTPTVVIAQRLAQDDLIGYIKETEMDDWDFFVAPTLDENDNSIWEDKFPAEQLKRMRTRNPFLFYSQYQQEPIVMGGEVIRGDWFRYYPLSVTYKYKKVFITADTALKVKECNDFSVFIVFGVTQDDRLHILDIVRGKWEAPELKKTAILLWNKWNQPDQPCQALYVEDKVSGTGLIQEIQASCGIPILPLKPEADKLTRVEAILPYLEAGLIYLPDSRVYGFNPDFVSECEAFTRDDSHKHDDQVDAFVYGVKIGISKLQVSILDVL